MCHICASVNPFQPNFLHEATNGTVIYEDENAPADTSTPYEIEPGDVFVGEIDEIGDEDWVAIELEAGVTYEITLEGETAGVGTLEDPHLYLYDADGNYLADNDAISLDPEDYNLDAALEFTAGVSGTFYLSASAYNDWGTGTYELSVVELSGDDPDDPPPASDDLEDMAKYLTHGYWEDTNRDWRAWDTSDSNQITVDLSGLDSDGAQLAEWALEIWEMVADVEFVEVGSDADITFTDDESGAFARTWTSFNEITSVQVNVHESWLDSSGTTTTDDYAFQTYIHEIGHALGLGHQGPYNMSADFDDDAIFDQDSWQYSVMSYFTQNENPNTDADYAFAVSAMMSDIMAVQSLYGAPGSSGATAGDTTFGANTNLDNIYGQILEAMVSGTTIPGVYDGGSIAMTLYAQGGYNTLDLSTSITDDNIDMREEHFSDVGGLTGNLGIAAGTVIHEVIGSSGDNWIHGNDADNDIDGYGGDNEIHTGGGNNIVRASDGNNTIFGGDGDNSLWGGPGDNVIYGGTGDDIIGGGPGDAYIEVAGGDNTIFGGLGNNVIHAEGDGDNRIWGGRGDGEIHVYGDGDNRVGGARGDDVIVIHGGGENTIYGGAGGGDNHITGGTGDDRIFAGPGNGIIDATAGGDNELFGGRGDDVIEGGDGNDTLVGGQGNDVLTGGAGADTFIFRANHDHNTITDFDVSDGDILLLEIGNPFADEDLWDGDLSAQEVVDQFAETEDGNTEIVFANGERITLEGFTDLSALVSQIEIVEL